MKKAKFFGLSLVVAGLFLIKATCGDDLVVSGEFASDGLNVVVSAPDGFTNRVEIYACSNLISGTWRVAMENLRPVGGTPVKWHAEVDDIGFFVAGNMDIDSDGDGLPDAREMFVYKTKPESADTDCDGMPDGWELQYGFNPSFYEGGGFDLDGDRLNNANEYLRGTRPDISDTDRDWLSDYAEAFIYKTDPLATNALDTSTGYTIEQTGYEWIDISQTGQAITNFSGMDDGVAQISLGLPFPLFDATYDTAYVCNNGFVSFGESSGAWGNEPLPSTSIPAKTLCVFWNDLYMKGNSEAAVYTQTVSNRFVISFEGIPSIEDETVCFSFQIIMHADGSILYQYKDVPSDGTLPTVGMQWDEGSVEFYAGNVTNGEALLISNGQDADIDLDGISDAWERKWFGGLDVVTNGSDFVTGDHLFTCAEAAYLGLNPNVTDTDGDGLSDKYEIENGTDPLVMQDADGDGMSDQFEIAHGLNPADPSDALADPDGDGFPNVYECRHGSSLFDSNSVPLPDRYISLAGQHIAPFTNSATAAINIQAALAAAAPYDIIRVADGAYTGEENRNLNFMGKPLMLISENGPENCILNGENEGRGLYIANSTGSVVRGIQFYHGYSDGGWNSGDGSGGAVCCENTRVLLENCWFLSNSAGDWGGAIYGLTSSIILKNCVFEDNGDASRFTGGAGCFDYNSSVEMIDCTVTGTLGDSGFYIYDSTFRLQSSTFLNNFCCSLEVSDSSGSISNCVFSDNQSLRDSGGVYFDSSDVVLSGCVFQNNFVAADYMGSGALRSWGGTLLAQNSVFSGNSSGEAAVSGGSIRLENCTLFGNHCPAVYGGGMVIRNTILWGNESMSYNSAEGIDIEFSCLLEIIGTNNIHMDPQLIAGTGALLPNSPCIDRGSDLTAPAADITGTPRWDHPGRSNGMDTSISDIGAFEFTDRDADGLDDLWEIYCFTNTTFSSGMDDVDGDGLSTSNEYRLNTNPWLTDTDGDGLGDGNEVNLHGTNPLCTDSDDDGLSDSDEINRHTNPLAVDSDADGMPDGWEVANGLNPLLSSDASSDEDRDGLTNLEEYVLGTDFRNNDTDGDGMPDGWESNNGFYPLWADSSVDADGDGLSNLEEYAADTNPRLTDTDGDGMPDKWEMDHNLNPLFNDALIDSDSDGLINLLEYQHGTDLHNSDTDGDGLTDGAEINIYGTSPLNADMNSLDADGDGLPDRWEVLHGLDPLVNDAAFDSDSDGLTNLLEYQRGSDPHNADTDGDGLTDGDEVSAHGTDPANADSDEDGLNDGVEVGIYCISLNAGAEVSIYGTNPKTGAEIKTYGTSPVNGDSDGDGAPDGREVLCDTDPMNSDTDGDGIPDNRDVTSDGLVLITVTNQLPAYHAQVSSGTGNPEYKATVTFIPVLPSNTVRIVNAVVDGQIDDSFKINGVQYGWTWGIKSFHKNITGALPNPTNGIFDIELYDYVDPGWYGNGVSISGTCVMDCLIPLKVDMIAYRPTTEGPGYNNPFQRWEIPEAQEENPGAGIRVNGDTESAANENDLIEVELKVEPYPAPSGVTYVLKRNSTNIKVWDSRTMGAVILDSGAEATITFSTATKTVWVEKPSGGTADLELIARSGNTDLCSDKVHFYPFTSIVIALGGEDQVPIDPANANHGVFNLAIDLYEQGYDVHMYDEDSVDRFGAGITYDEIVSAIQHRNVNQVAIYGYSHGGGSTFLLANLLNNNRGAIGTFTIPFTAYIDAVSDEDGETDMRQEHRRPPSSAFHMNYYQEGSMVDAWLDGGPVNNPPGADFEVDVDSPVPTETHVTIDDDDAVSNGVETRLTSRVVR